MERKGVPNELLLSLKGVEGFDEKSFIDVHENSRQVVSIRINPAKISASPFPESKPIPWSSTGYYLPDRPSFTLDPLLHAGAYYVQEASGMFLEQCLKQTIDLSLPLKVLDLCAAPGGKSTLIQSFLSEESLLVSNEVIKSRASILVENISKWGNENVIVTNNDPRDFSRLPEYFDVIVADAPCSGSGLFRRDVNAIDEWSIGAVESCSLRQQRILSDAYVSLKQNGVLIYSTCSYSPEENEQICDWLIRNYDVTPLKIAVNPNWNIVYTESDLRAAGYRFFPDKIRGEGFFIACFRKNDGASTAEVRTKRSKMVKVTAAERDILLPWIRENCKDNIQSFPLLSILHSFG